MGDVRAVMLAALFIFLDTGGLLAQQISLRANEGQLVLRGRLLGYDGTYYRLETPAGSLSVDAAGVTCNGDACPDVSFPRIVMSGAAAMGRVLIPAMISGFAERNGWQMTRTDSADGSVFDIRDGDAGPNIARFEMRVHTTNEGLVELMAGETDLAMARRNVQPFEMALAKDAGLGDLGSLRARHVLALDALVPIVAPGNPVTEISPDALRAVLEGRIRNWSALGGPDQSIALHLPVADMELGQSLDAQVMRGTEVTQAAKRHDTMIDLVQAVLQDRAALGIGRLSDTDSARALDLRGACGFVLRATRDSIKTGDYPYVVPLALYVPARHVSSVLRDFLAFTQSRPGHLIVRRTRFVDMAVIDIPVAQQGERLANAIDIAGTDVSLQELQRMVRSLSRKTRLSQTFRFEPGTIRLDGPSQANLRRVTQAVGQGMYSGRTLMLVGFTDGAGPARANRDLALARADSVRRMIMAGSGGDRDTRLEVEAFAEALPMACDDTVEGQQTNRRVELWIE